MERAIPKRTTAPHKDLEMLREQLQIDRDDLDTGLVEQPDLYYHVAEAFVLAVAKRDEAKLDLEQATADLDKQFREAAAEADPPEKLTEAAITRKLASAPRIQTLERGLLRLRVEADKWQALKESFQQRSFMLRELVAIFVRRMGDVSLEHGNVGARRDLISAQAEKNHAAASEVRRQRRSERS